MTRFIYLKSGQQVLVDDRDYDWLSKYTWCYSKNGGYAVRYAVVDGKRKMIFMHREIMDAPPHVLIDHKNQRRRDNQRANLRFCTPCQSQANKGKLKTNTSGYKGVCWRRGKWEARIQFQGRRLLLGRTASKGEAAMMYDIASKLLNKEFAALNFPTTRPSRPLEDHVENVLRRYNLR
jgi:hypothetical protein